jgi:hypothetical protein
MFALFGYFASLAIHPGVSLVAPVLALVLFAAGPSPVSQLPATAPGLSRDEGVFLVTAADDGSRVVYFVAQNSRHAITESDLQIEEALNPLWPVRVVARDEVMSFPEGAPVGVARVGRLDPPVLPAETAPVADVAPAIRVAELPLMAGAPADEPATTYTVQKGDSAIGIARDLGIDLDALLETNAIADRDLIYAGQVLTIPGE